jgi:hypothetical protein
LGEERECTWQSARKAEKKGDAMLGRGRGGIASGSEEQRRSGIIRGRRHCAGGGYEGEGRTTAIIVQDRCKRREGKRERAREWRRRNSSRRVGARRRSKQSREGRGRASEAQRERASSNSLSLSIRVLARLPTSVISSHHPHISY